MSIRSRAYFELGRSAGQLCGLQYLAGLIDRRHSRSDMDAYSSEFLSALLADKQRSVVALGMGGASLSDLSDYGAGHEAGFSETVHAGADRMDHITDLINADTARLEGRLQ